MEPLSVPSSAPNEQELLPRLRGTDSLLENFVRIVLPPPEASVVLRGFYTEALHAVLLTRLAALRESEIDDQGWGARALSKWRLRRVYEFVDANLEKRISLRMLAGAAGISRMYFAAQFRAATGVRPHSFVARRRMEHAKALLVKPGSSIVDIAFSVGFQTQSHFTTVFKRLEGVTPHRWRELHGVGGSGLTDICKDYGRGGAQPGL